MRLLVPLRETRVALLWGGLSLSAMGDQLYLVALTWIAVGVFGADAGYLTALGAAGVLATALFAGRWADRWEQRRAMVAADAARAAILLAVVAAWMATRRPSAAGLVMAVLVLAAGQGVFRPALQSLLPALVGDAGQLPAANALLDTTDRIARLLGPGLVGLLAPLVPAMHFLTLDAATFVASAAALLLIGRGHPLPALRRHGAPDGVMDAVLRGFRVTARHRLLRFELSMTGIINGAWYATFFLGLPLMIARHGVSGPFGAGGGGAGLGAYGLVISAYGCTNLLATLVVGGRGLPENPARLLFAGNVVLASGMGLLALAEGMHLPPHWLLPAYCGAAAVTAIGGPMHDIPIAVLRQTELPRPDVPAAMRAYLVMNNAGLLAAMLAAPALFAALPAAPVIGACATAPLLFGVAGLARFRQGSAIPGRVRQS